MHLVKFIGSNVGISYGYLVVAPKICLGLKFSFLFWKSSVEFSYAKSIKVYGFLYKCISINLEYIIVLTLSGGYRICIRELRGGGRILIRSIIKKIYIKIA